MASLKDAGDTIRSGDADEASRLYPVTLYWKLYAQHVLCGKSSSGRGRGRP